MKENQSVILFYLSLTEKKHPEKFPRLNRPTMLCADTTSFSSLPVSESEDEPGKSIDSLFKLQTSL